MPLLRHQPHSTHSFQTENWILDPNYYWTKMGQVGWDGLLTLEQQPETLWINGYNTYHGVNDRIPIEQAAILTDSLKLIRVDGVTLQVHAASATFGEPKRVVRAGFRHSGAEYVLRVTDPEYEREYLAKSNGNYSLSEAFLTVSLGEPYKGFAYKLTAAIVERAKVEPGGER